MLDLKLALYLPFLEAMEPGVFITASDDIEVRAPPLAYLLYSEHDRLANYKD